MTASKGPGSGDKRHRYTADEQAAALEVLKSDGLAAAARHAACSKSTILRWARNAGLDPADYADRSTAQNEAAARAAVAAPKAATAAARATMSVRLLEQLAPKAATLLLARLEEDERNEEHVREAEDRLEAAIMALQVAGTPPEDADIDMKKRYADLRKTAKADVVDAKLILEAWRGGRTRVPELVGVLTRALNDHLTLDGDAADQEAATGTIHVTLSAPRPQRRPGSDPIVTLPADQPSGVHR